MGKEIYLGYSSELEPLRYPLGGSDAKHWLFLGYSGYGKTWTLRAMMEEIKRTYPKAMVIAMELKHDKTKAQDLGALYIKELQRLGDPGKVDKLYPGLRQYVEKWDEDPRLGFIGDFAFSIPNYIAQAMRLWDSRETLLTWHGLKPEAFPVKRFVFAPRRSTEAILLDNSLGGYFGPDGDEPRLEVVNAKIPYRRLSFDDISLISHIEKATVYGRRIKNLWEYEGIKDPDRLLRRAYQMDLDNGRDPEKKPSATFLSIKEVAHMLKGTRYLSRDGNFFEELSHDHINVLDFSRNSKLTLRDEVFIFSKLVEWLIEEYSGDEDVFLFLDEIQNILRFDLGREAVDKLLREGRSGGFHIMASTQYLHRLPRFLLYGSSNVAIVGRISSPDDYSLLSKFSRDFKRKVDPRLYIEDPETGARRRVKNWREYLIARKREKGRGWVLLDREWVERIYYRPPQSL